MFGFSPFAFQSFASISEPNYVTGVQATGYIANVLVWGQINTNQDPHWAGINDSQTGNWNVVNDNQVPGWVQVNDSQSPAWSAINEGNTVVWTNIPT